MGKGYSHLDIRERAVIEMNLALGKRPGAIAIFLSRARSTILREIRRNGWRRPSVLPRSGHKMPDGRLSTSLADRRAQRMARRARVKRKLVPGAALWSLMEKHLRLGLSPAQIESTLARASESSGSGCRGRPFMERFVCHAARAAACQPVGPDAPTAQDQKIPTRKTKSTTGPFRI